MIIPLPDPAAATVRSVTRNAQTVTVVFPVRDASQQDQLLALLEYARDGGFAVELKLLHYKGRPARMEKPCRPTP